MKVTQSSQHMHVSPVAVICPIFQVQSKCTQDIRAICVHVLCIWLHSHLASIVCYLNYKSLAQLVTSLNYKFRSLYLIDASKS